MKDSLEFAIMGASAFFAFGIVGAIILEIIERISEGKDIK